MPITPEQQEEIDALRREKHETRRATVPAIEEILYEARRVLDHGFVRVVDYMGDDAAIVQAARVSYGRGTKRTRDDQGLINYLMRNAHTSPFEMCEIKLHVKLPIFVARQWIRHRMANVNEYSARYSELENEFYLPPDDRMAIQSQSNRQGRREPRPGDMPQLFFLSPPPPPPTRQSEEQGEILSVEEASEARDLLRNDALHSFEVYRRLLNKDETGQPLHPSRQALARELARINLPLSTYTQWYWKIDLHNLLHFLALRADPHAQWEIREYADMILDIVERWVPLTAKAFRSYRRGGVRLSAQGLAAVKRLVAGENIDNIDYATLGMSLGEWRELKETLGLDVSGPEPPLRQKGASRKGRQRKAPLA